jgi:hypothetical protein
MNDQKEADKISKFAEKKKSAPIIKILAKADKETTIAGLKALGSIGDEDSINMLTHFFDNEDGEVRLAACKAALVINDSYIQTRVRHQLAVEKDEKIKAGIQEALNSAKN